MSPITQNDRQRRILQLSSEWGLPMPPAPKSLTRPLHVPTFVRHGDDEAAENLLQRRAADNAHLRPKSGLSRVFSSTNLKKGKHWNPCEIVDVLASHVDKGGSAGVAEVLIAKLSAAGVDLSGNQQSKSGLLNRRKSMDTLTNRTRLLRLATNSGSADLVQVLIPHADPLAIDASLPEAIRRGDHAIVQILLMYGATVGGTADGQDAFCQACNVHDQTAMIGMILNSTGRPSPDLISQAMVKASQHRCLDNVIQLSRSTGDGNHNQGEALVTAVSMGQRDIALAIITGSKPPQPSSLNSAFTALNSHTSISLTTKLHIAELLLCAGALGEAPAAALEQACKSQCYPMASLLCSHNVSIEYNDASALKYAIKSGEWDLVETLLRSAAPLNPQYASSCVEIIPKQASFEARYSLLVQLLRRGANGHVLSQCLLHAAESGDLSSVDLLLSPRFPQHNSGVSNGTTSPLSTHAVASTDYRHGEALRTAVLRADMVLAQKLLQGRPSPQTIKSVFPLAVKMDVQHRYQMVGLFLNSSLAGDCLHTALQEALAQPRSQRDGNLIKQLVTGGADINYKSGEGLVPLIKQMDLNLISNLRMSISPQTAASRIPDAMKVADPRSRLEMIRTLLTAGAAVGVLEIASATLQTLSEKRVDMSLLQLLLKTGGANINGCDGAIIPKAIENPDPAVLELVLSHGSPSASSIARGLDALAPTLSNDVKKFKFESILSKSATTIDLSRLLFFEVQSIVTHKARQPSLDILEMLLNYNADPNASSAGALRHSVIAAHVPVINQLLKSRIPIQPESLGIALPHALQIVDPTSRRIVTRALVGAGAPPTEVNRALQYAIKVCPHDAGLIELLSSKADTGDGEVLSLAVEKESLELTSLLLKNTSSSSRARSDALTQAMGIKTRHVRHDICKQLLASGVPAETASVALLVAARDGDVDLCVTSMAHGASNTKNHENAIIEACRRGFIDLLKVLLKQGDQTPKRKLNEAFQAATEVRDLGTRAAVFQHLLHCGASGESIDAQLQSAARYGELGESLLKVLLAGGADPNYNTGEAVVAATRSAVMRSLQLLLGLWDDGKIQKPPSQPTLVRALKASWNLDRDTRYAIVEDLLKAGLQPCEHLHMTLNDAVNESDPEERLVRLLLDNGASATANSCKSLVDAVRNMASPCLALMLQREATHNDIYEVFNGAFTTETFSKWFTLRGLKTAELLLDKGATGDALSNCLLLVMQRATPETSGLADEFFELLVSHGVDVNYNRGQLLQQAASMAKVDWTRKLLNCRPTSETLSLAFQCIFDTEIREDEVLVLFELFAEHREGDAEIDLMMTAQGTESVLVRAMKQYPRSPLILSTLLNAGFHHSQLTTYALHPDVGEEEVTLLSWAIAQPQKRVSQALIELLVERGANVNVVSSESRTTPLMLAILHRLPEVVKLLLIEGAEVDIIDYRERTPLFMATEIEGDLAVKIMTSILAAKPSHDDGSLHNAARMLNWAGVKVLVQAGHQPDFPSPLHQGRSALGEVCRWAAIDAEMSPERERLMQKVMTFLIDAGSNLAIHCNGKPLLYLCFASAAPVATTRALLTAGMWKHINESFNRCTDERYTYSPTMYISKAMPSLRCREELLSVLRDGRALNVYYATSGDMQPNDAVGLPNDMAARDRARRARIEQLAHDTEDHNLMLTRRRQIASLETEITLEKTAIEDTRRRQQHSEDMGWVHDRAALQDSIDAALHQRRINEQHAISEAAMGRTRALAAAEMEIEETRQRQFIEWEMRKHMVETEHLRVESALKMREREEMERMDRGAEQRFAKRIEAQKDLIKSQESLARQLANGPTGVGVGPRQIGYVTELN